MNARYERLPIVADYTENNGDFQPVSLTSEHRQKTQSEIYSQSPMMEIRDLSVTFPIRNGWGRKTGEVNAVNKVSFDVFPGETLGLVGESGCGKTTLSRALLQLIDPTSGSVLFEEEDLCQLKGEAMRKKRKDLQIIFQDPYSSLNPRRTIGQAIREPMDVHGIGERSERRNRVIELLEKVGLSAEHYDRYPHEFSGGQRQRIGIARALAVEPKFIICDESVSALDVSVQAQVLNLLNDLKREMGLTYIFISHDLSVVKYMSDRMIVMNKGVIEEYGDADEIYANPKTPYTQKLIAAIPRGISD
jgi:peptide/nickel transport system ATP-binding protein